MEGQGQAPVEATLVLAQMAAHRQDCTPGLLWQDAAVGLLPSAPLVPLVTLVRPQDAPAAYQTQNKKRPQC